MTEPSPELKAAIARVHEALESLTDVLAPRSCPHEHDWTECEEDDCQWTNTFPMSDSMMLTEWVVLSGWADLVSGENYISFQHPVNQLRSHTSGLLLEALRGS